MYMRGFKVVTLQLMNEHIMYFKNQHFKSYYSSLKKQKLSNAVEMSVTKQASLVSK